MLCMTSLYCHLKYLSASGLHSDMIWRKSDFRKIWHLQCGDSVNLGRVDFDYGVTLADGLLLLQQDGGTSQNSVSQTRVHEQNRHAVHVGFSKNLIISKSCLNVIHLHWGTLDGNTGLSYIISNPHMVATWRSKGFRIHPLIAEKKTTLLFQGTFGHTVVVCYYSICHCS